MAENKIDDLIIDIDYSASQASTGIENLATALSNLKDATSGTTKNLTNIFTSLSNVGNISSQLRDLDFGNFAKSIESLKNSVKPITELGKSNLGNLFNQLKKIPDISKTLDDKAIEEFTNKINKLSTALVPLSNNLSKVGNVLSNMPSKLNKVSNYTSKAQSSMTGLSSVSKLLNFGAILAFSRQIGTAFGGFIAKSNEYVEDLNLFNVAMGESTERAKEWIDTVSETLGLDPAPMMRYMGVFNMMATGFGLSSQAAEKMSKNLTQLTYDISSFYNLKIDEAAQKVQSAFAGKIICLICKGLHIITYLIAGTPKRVMA